VQQVAHAILTTDVHVQGPLLLASSQSQSQSQVSPPSPEKSGLSKTCTKLNWSTFHTRFPGENAGSTAAAACNMQHASSNLQPATCNLPLD